MARRSIPFLPVVAGLLFVDLVGYSALIPVLPALRDRLGVSDVATGVLLGGLPLGTMIATLPMGRLADRIGPRALTIAGAVTVGGAFVAFALIDSYPGLIAARLVQGFGSTALWVGGPAWVAVGEAAGRGRRMAVVTGTGMAGTIVGAGFGGWSAATFGMLSAFTVLGAVALVGAGIALLLTTRPDMEPAPAGGLTAAIVRGFASPRFRTGATTTLLASVIGSAEAALLTLALGARGFDEGRLGLWLSVGGVALVVGQVSGPRLVGRLGTGQSIGLAGVGVAAVAGFAVVRPTDAMLVAALVAIPLCAGLLYGLSLELLAGGSIEVGSSAAMGISYWNLAWALGATLGPVFITGVLQHGGEQVALGLVAAMSTAVIGTGLARRRHPAI